MRLRNNKRSLPVAIVVCCATSSVPAAASALGVTWMKGFTAPGTPARYDKVGVIKVGPRSARNVLVLEPGTSAGSAYFVPLAKWIVASVKGWQVWSVERRENLLEDQSYINLGKSGKASSQRVFNYYLGYPNLKPSVRVTNLGQYGYALNVGTSPPNLAAAQARLGKGVAVKAVNGVHGWNGTGALTPIKRLATMFSGLGMDNVDGTEWYFPQRLANDTRAVGTGLPNPAQAVLDVHATMGRHLPRSLRIYAFGAALGGPGVPLAARQLANQSHIPLRNLTLLNRQSTYAHNDPAGGYPENVFFAHLVPFLKKIGLL
jgi:hypothetical protein